MHARIDQLLSLRDGEPVDAGVERHLAECRACATELVRLRQMKHRLQQLESFDPPSMSSLRLDVQRTSHDSNASRRRSGKWAGWAVAAGCVLVVAMGLALRDHGSDTQHSAARSAPADVDDQVAATAAEKTVSRGAAHGASVSEAAASSEATVQPKRNAASLERLVAQSRHLEELLLALPERPSIERVAQAATIDTLEHRIQWLDEQLSYAPEHGLNDSQAYRLWRERVDLMDSLVKVRYAEGRYVNF